MNNTFNLQRFGLLLKRQWLEFGKIYLISLLVVLGVFLAFYGFAAYKLLVFEESPKLNTSIFIDALYFRAPLFIIMGLLFITVIASNYFANFGQKSKAIIELLIPGSTFEKFLTALFFTAILSTLSFVILFYLTDLAFVAKFNGKEDTISYFFSAYSDHIYKPAFIIPLYVTSIFLLGSIYFNKFHYIKTAISVLIFSGIFSAVIFRAGEWLFAGKVMIDPSNRIGNNMTQSTAEWLGVLVLFTMTVAFWAITYVRLKEKQV